MQTKTKIKVKTNTQTKIAVGLMTAGVAALAAALVLGGQGSNLSINTSANTQTIIDKTADSTIGSIVLKAGDKDIAVSSIPITVEVSSADLKNGSLIKNVKLMTQYYSCSEYYVNSPAPVKNYGYNPQLQKKEIKFICSGGSGSYGYNQLEQIAGANNLSVINSKKGETVFNFAHSLLIPAGQTRTIFVKADLGDFGGKQAKIKAYINSYNGLTVKYADKSSAKVSLSNKHDWTTIMPQKPVSLLPDLIIEKVKIAKRGGLLGKILGKNYRIATIYVKNIGSEAADFSNIPFSLAISRGGKNIASRSSRISKLKIAGGEVKSYELSFNLVSGTNDLTFTVDNEGKMQEKNENNNSYKITVK